MVDEIVNNKYIIRNKILIFFCILTISVGIYILFHCNNVKLLIVLIFIHLLISTFEATLYAYM